jgi:SWI/SNF-related matrix-associated actin-dependent regulator of chromatin subfamily A-like protein 1
MLYPFQEEAVQFLMAEPHRLLAHEPGLGKTIMALEAAARLGCKSILIICPAIIKETWAKHIEDWTTFDSKSIQILKKKTDKILDKRIIILNYELLYGGTVHKQLLQKKFDLAIVDECHKVKNTSSKISNILLAKHGKRPPLLSIAYRKILLTGTPMPNRPIELYPILKTLAPKSLGPYTTYESFGNRFCDPVENDYGINYDGASNIEELKQRLSGFMLRREIHDVWKELPDKVVSPIYCNIDLDIDERDTPLATLRKQLGDAKIPFVVEYIKDKMETEIGKCVVFAYSRSVIETIANHEKLAKFEPVFIYGSLSYEDKAFALKYFKTNSNCRIIVLQYNAAGVGLDGLQQHSNCMVMAEPDWSAGTFDQAIGRLHRIGQNELVRVYPIIALNTLDESIFGVYNKKSNIIRQVLNNGKEIKTVKQIKLSRVAT